MEFKRKKKKASKKVEEVVEDAEVEAFEVVKAEEKPLKKKKADGPVLVTEFTFLKGEEVELKGIKFVVSEISGLKLVLKREDIK